MEPNREHILSLSFKSIVTPLRVDNNFKGD